LDAEHTKKELSVTNARKDSKSLGGTSQRVALGRTLADGGGRERLQKCGYINPPTLVAVELLGIIS